MDEEVIGLLQDAITKEFRQWDLYYAYKDQVTGGGRDPIIEHFEEHADDEADHIEILQRYLINCYNTVPSKERLAIPTLDSPSTGDIIKLQLKFEMEAVDNYKNMLKTLEDKEECKSLIIDIENILTDEQEHVHDLQMYVKEKATAAYIIPKELDDYMATLGIKKELINGVWMIREEHLKLLKDFVKRKGYHGGQSLTNPKRITLTPTYRN